MPVQALCTVAEAVKLNAFAFSLTLDVGEELAGQVACGQFIHIKCGHSRLLRRPISVCDWMGDTLRGMRIDVNTRRPILKQNTGGLSGPAVLPVAVRMVWEVSGAVQIPVLGMGGVATAEDAAQLMLAGASAVAVGTACFADPYAPLKVRDGLAALAARQGLERVSQLTGAVRPW